MKPIATAGVALAVMAGLWLFVHGFAVFYKNPNLGWLFPVGASVIELGALLWALKQTALEGRGYGGQVLAGLLVALIAGALIMPMTLAWTAVFPDVFEIQEAAMADGFADRGMGEEEIQRMVGTTAVITWAENRRGEEAGQTRYAINVSLSSLQSMPNLTPSLPPLTS